MKLTFHDNKVDGEEIKVKLSTVVDEYIKWENKQGEKMILQNPFERRFLLFLIDYEPKPGLKSFQIFEDDDWKEIYDLYKARINNQPN